MEPAAALPQGGEHDEQQRSVALIESLDALSEQEYREAVHSCMLHHAGVDGAAAGPLHARVEAHVRELHRVVSAKRDEMRTCYVVLRGCTPLYGIQCTPPSRHERAYRLLLCALLHPTFGIARLRSNDEEDDGVTALPAAWQRVNESTQELETLNTVLQCLHRIHDGKGYTLADDAGVTYAELKTFYDAMHARRNGFWRSLGLPRTRRTLRRTVTACQAGDIIAAPGVYGMGARFDSLSIACRAATLHRRCLSDSTRAALRRLHDAGVFGTELEHAARSYAHGHQSKHEDARARDAVGLYLLGSDAHRPEADELMLAHASTQHVSRAALRAANHVVIKVRDIDPGRGGTRFLTHRCWRSCATLCLNEYVDYANELLSEADAERVSLSRPAASSWDLLLGMGKRATEFYGGRWHISLQTSRQLYRLAADMLNDDQRIAIPQGYFITTGHSDAGLCIANEMRLEVDECMQPRDSLSSDEESASSSTSDSESDSE